MEREIIRWKTYRLHLMSLWQHLIQLRSVLRILRHNFDVCALHSVFPVCDKIKKKKREETAHMRRMKKVHAKFCYKNCRVYITIMTIKLSIK